MKRRIRITIEVDTDLDRGTFNAYVRKVVENNDPFGVDMSNVVYLATEEVEPRNVVFSRI